MGNSNRLLDPVERVRDLRRQGKTRREIMEGLGITEWTLNAALRNEPLREGATRPRAKDSLRAEARALRLQGLDYDEIVAQLGVSKSSVSLWVRDLPRPGRLSDEAIRQRTAERTRRHWQAEREVRNAQRAAMRNAAMAEVGQLSDHEVLVAGAIVYWCEGSKNKPHRRYDRVSFMNSDPGLIQFFLRFLDVNGMPRSDVRFTLSIHEGANVEAAHAFWQEVTRAGLEQFNKPVIKCARPRTRRKNTGESYRGCLRVDVRRGMDLYRKIEGWASAVMGGNF
jgi:hypothetical protein